MENALPRLYEPAPQFTALSTRDEISLSDYRGRWVVLFSYVADFTPVCTSEIVSLAKAAPEFEAAGIQLVGLSGDSVYSHLAWLMNLEQNFDVKVPFPVIADTERAIAGRYGMIQGGQMVRAVFIIDPEQRLRASQFYPVCAGRSVAEILRLVRALQAHASAGMVTPEGWTPAQKCVVPAPTSVNQVSERMQSSYNVVTWYFARSY